MPGARHLLVVLLAAIWIVGACSTAAPAAQPGSTVALTPGSSAEPTAIPPSNSPAPVTAAPTRPPATAPPTPAPPTPEPTTPEDRPNLIILGFEVEEDPVLINVPATLTATFANIGSADAGPFSVEIVLATAGEPEVVLASKAVEGLAAGDLTVLTASINQSEAAELSLIARVDMTDEVREEDDSDNERVVEIEVKDLGNVNVPVSAFSVVPHPDAPGTFLFYFTIANTGTSAILDTVSVKFFAYTSAGQYVEWGSHNLELDLAPDASQSLVVAYAVAPDSYRAYVLADPDNTFEESDEGDNQAYFDFTAP